MDIQDNEFIFDKVLVRHKLTRELLNDVHFHGIFFGAKFCSKLLPCLCPCDQVRLTFCPEIQELVNCPLFTGHFEGHISKPNTIRGWSKTIEIQVWSMLHNDVTTTEDWNATCRHSPV